MSTYYPTFRFAWGETQPKSVYDWSTYKWSKGTYNSLTKYCTKSERGKDGYNGFCDNKTELEPADDAATASWGSDWRMPSLDQIKELLDNCSSQWTTQNGVNGRLFTGKRNGASLFLPAAGCSYDKLLGVGSVGCYWSRTLYSSDPCNAGNLYFHSVVVYWRDWNSFGRNFGKSVRAVCVSRNERSQSHSLLVGCQSIQRCAVP